MAKPDPKLVLNRNIVFREEDDGAFLFNPDTDALHCINPIGAAICRLCDGTKSLADILEWVSDHYEVGVSRQRMHADINGFIERLVSLDLIRAN